MVVYLIQAGAAGAVKIGWAKDAISRMADLQVGAASKLSILRVIETSKPSERLMHWRFRGSRIRGEWFTFDPDMLTVNPDKIVKPGRVRRAFGGDHPLTAYRERECVSIQSLAEAANTSRQTIFRIERRHVSPSLGLVSRIIKATAGAVGVADFLPKTEAA